MEKDCGGTKMLLPDGGGMGGAGGKARIGFPAKRLAPGGGLDRL